MEPREVFSSLSFLISHHQLVFSQGDVEMLYSCVLDFQYSLKIMQRITHILGGHHICMD